MISSCCLHKIFANSLIEAWRLEMVWKYWNKLSSYVHNVIFVPQIQVVSFKDDTIYSTIKDAFLLTSGASKFGEYEWFLLYIASIISSGSVSLVDNVWNVPVLYYISTASIFKIERYLFYEVIMLLKKENDIIYLLFLWG